MALLEKIKIKKVEKLVQKLHDKTGYIGHYKILKKR